MCPPCSTVDVAQTGHSPAQRAAGTWLRKHFRSNRPESEAERTHTKRPLAINHSREADIEFLLWPEMAANDDLSMRPSHFRASFARSARISHLSAKLAVKVGA